MRPGGVGKLQISLTCPSICAPVATRVPDEVMQSTDFVALMQELAPLELAETWDNVGVLVQRVELPVNRVMLTIDLTDAVLVEALRTEVDAIVAYHPPIFGGLKRIVASDPKGNLVAQLIHAGVLVYSPHTALDSVVGGVNDWLLAPFSLASVAAINPTSGSTDVRLGQGRIATLNRALALSECIGLVKDHLKLSHVRVSRAPQHERTPIERIAVCAGAGGSLLARCRADLLVTGEMRHHDVLEHREQGTSVILTDHTNSERGYLSVLKERLEKRAPGLSVLVSNSDADPLSIN